MGSMGPGAPRARILVADDDVDVVEALASALEDEGAAVVKAFDSASAVAAAAAHAPDVAFIDLRMPGTPTIDLLPEIAAIDPALPVVIVTGYGTIELAVAAMRAGAYDFLEKPVRRDVLVPLLERALAHRRMRRELARLREALAGAAAEALLGESAPMVRLREDIARVSASSAATALVLGESGTGKELVARAIHDSGPRTAGPWVAVNCAALAGPLLEAELFGYERGAFTGADPAGREGLFEQAQGGTLFLDEVGELEVGLQAKLLRALEERTIRRLGASSDRAVDLRIVAASNRDLPREAREGRFRADLYYRLAVISLVVPPLRERGDDVTLLARAFLERLRAQRRHDLEGFEAAAEDAIRAHAWPGNVRELRNAIERAGIVARGPRIRASDLALAPAPSLPGPHPRVRPLEAVERELIEAAMAESEGNVSLAARRLGIHRTTLHRKLEQLRVKGMPAEGR
jgi:two-component system, NtrC family, response regulator HydG